MHCPISFDLGSRGQAPMATLNMLVFVHSRAWITDLPIHDLNVNESSGFHGLPLYIIFHDGATAIHLLRSLDEELSPFIKRASRHNRAIVTLHYHGWLVALNPTAWLAHSVCMFEQS